MKIISSSLNDTKKIAKIFRNNIYPFSNVLIYGNMGSGKTHFVKYLLKEIGIKKEIKSPTYSLSNFYKCEFGDIWHYDIFRISNKDNFFDIEEHFESDDFVIVEWANNLKYKPKNRIEIKIKIIDKNTREFDFKFFGTSLNEKEIKELFKKYNTPKHVVSHIKLVTKIADKTSKNLINNGIIVDKKLVHTGAMLHDIIRYIDFNGGIYKEKFPYKVTDKEILFWRKIAKKYEGMHHADATGIILKKMGYKEIANVVIAHKSRQIFKSLSTIEEKIVYYADKRVLHNKIVSIKERLEDGKIRYHKEGKNDFWINLFKELKKLEKELMQ